MLASHTLLPLSSERLLILTNRLWACNPHRPPVELRANPDLFRAAMFNFLDIAAGREEWLYPERDVRFNWRAVGDDHLLMPDPRSLQPGAEWFMGYAGGRIESMDAFGRRPGDQRFGHEARSGPEMHAHELEPAA